MKFKNGLLFFLLLSMIVAGALSFSGCANIIPPLGGPKDTLAPRLVSVNPPAFSRHFTGNKIIFSFDEYIDPKDVSSELIVSPLPKSTPITYAHLRLMTVKLKDTLQPNTTYSLNFHNAIRDVNEGNILRNFTYVFSTGNTIDSAGFSGHIYIAATGKKDSTIVAMLYDKLDDSAVVKTRPRYVTRLDSTGQFRFQYIKPGTYALYGLKDEGGTFRYLSTGQLFAFADSPVVIGGSYTPVTLYAYEEAQEIKPKKSGDNKPVPAGKKSEKEKEKDKRLQFTTNINAGEFDVLDTLHFNFGTGLKIFDSTKLEFVDENFIDIPPNRYHYEIDSARKKVRLIYLSPWPTDSKYFVIADRDFAVDSANRRLLKTDTITFHTKKETEYGEVRIRIPNLDLSRNPILQFVQGETLKHSYTFFRNKVFRAQLFEPGEYELRILYDANGNGHWDPGQFIGKHQQPEIVQPIPKKFNVKANWDNEKDILL
jgi:uncharacterized protein (DUF2141 family)